MDKGRHRKGKKAKKMQKLPTTAWEAPIPLCQAPQVLIPRSQKITEIQTPRCQGTLR